MAQGIRQNKTPPRMSMGGARSCVSDLDGGQAEDIFIGENPDHYAHYSAPNFGDSAALFAIAVELVVNRVHSFGGDAFDFDAVFEDLVGHLEVLGY